MSFWSAEKLISAGNRVIEGFDKDRLDCNAYVLRMGDEYFSTADSKKTPPKTVQLGLRETFVINPGQFAYLLTKEIVKVPASAMAFISMRTEVKFSGLINVSGFHVNPGYEGRLVYAVYNAGPAPVQIRQGDGLFKIWFSDLDRESKAPHIENPKSFISDISNAVSKGMNQEVLSLGSLSDRVKGLDTQMKVQWGIFAAMTAVALVLMGIFLTEILESHHPVVQVLPISSAPQAAPIPPPAKKEEKEQPAVRMAPAASTSSATNASKKPQ